MRRTAAAVIAVACVLMMAGCALTFCVNKGFDADASYDGTNLNYRFDSGLPADFRYIVYSNVDVAEKLYLFFDEKETSVYSGEAQNALLNPMEKLLKDRGFANIERIDSQGLRGKIDSGTEHTSAVLFYTGKIPDEISSSGLTQWMSEGNTVYWIGQGLKPLLGDDVSDREDTKASVQSEFAKANNIGFFCCDYGVKKTRGLCVGLCDDEYSSITVMDYLSGRLMVMGGDPHPFNFSDLPSLQHLLGLAGYIVSGITEHSEIVKYDVIHKGYFGYSASVKVEIPADSLFYISAGSTYSEWAKTVRL